MRRSLAACILVLGVACGAPASAAPFWLSSDSDLIAAQSDTVQLQAPIKQPALAAIHADRGGDAWVLASGRLIKFSPEGVRQNEIDVAALGFGSAVLLTVDPYDDGIWVATSGRALVHFDGRGVPIGSYSLTAVPRAMTLGVDQSVWLLSGTSMSHHAPDGHLLETVSVSPFSSADAFALSVDSLGGRLWIVQPSRVSQVGLANPSSAALIRDVKGKVADSALDPQTGTLWVLTGTQLLGFGRDGALERTVELDAVGVENIRTVAYESGSKAILLGGTSGFAQLVASGDVVALVETPVPVEHIAARPFHLAPALTLSEGADRAAIAIQLGALCSGMPCGFAASYFDGYRIGATLNGRSISEQLIRSQDGTQLRYAPEHGIPAGRDVFAAEVIDTFGHRSNRIETRLGSPQGSATTASPDATTASGATTASTLQSSSLTIQAGGANQSPTATITAPVANATFAVGSNIVLDATASDSDGTVAKVEFLRDGSTLIGSDTTAPYEVTWSNVPAGTYSLTARATDNKGATGTSAAVNISVVANVAPTVSLTAPANGAVLEMGTAIALTATASDLDGTIAKVEFLDGSTLIAEDTSSPYAATWTPTTPGTHTITARATDDKGAATTSTAAVVNLVSAPLVVLTSPTPCLQTQSPATLTLAADAVSPDDATITKVEFFDGGSTLIGTDTVAPYSIAWSDVQAGSYVVTARATDSRGLQKTSRAVTLTVTAPNVAPSVALTAPADGASIQQGTTVSVTAVATDSDGTIAQVSCYANGALIGSTSSTPYSVTWVPAATGSYQLTAVATDNSGASTTSTARTVTVTPNALPSVSLTAPAAGATFREPATINLAATAADSDGTIARVEFYAGSVLVGTATAAPYAAVWSNAGPGNYSLIARAIDNAGGTTTSASVNIIVNANAHPTVSVTAPSSGASYYTPATITVSANAADSDGSVARVEFYASGTLIGTDSTAPYSIIWDEVGGGNYILTAVAIDDGGFTTTSGGVNVSVSPAPTLTILEPVVDPTYGVAAGVESVYVRGLVDAPPNSSVIVNGQLAVIDDYGQFHANNVPLGSGTTTVTVTVITQDGQTSSESIDVLNAGPAAFTVAPDTSEGLGSQTVLFTTTDRGTAAIQRVEYDFTSDGSVDYTVNVSSFVLGQYAFNLTYPAPGRYVATVRAFDQQNALVQTVRYAIVIRDPVKLSGMLQGVYGQMLDRLRAGNLDRALDAFTGAQQRRYREIFTALQPQMPGVIDQFGSIQGSDISQSLAEFAVVRGEGSQATASLIYFIRAEDGIWRLDAF